MKKIILIGLFVLSLIIIGCGPDNTYDPLAKCLTEKGVKFYGAFWCPHCESVKENFKDSAKYLPYVECDPRGVNAKPDECDAQGVESYPTFIFSDGSRLTGARPNSVLAQKAGCPLT